VATRTGLELYSQYLQLWYALGADQTGTSDPEYNVTRPTPKSVNAYRGVLD
jgi:hypothetical protein